MFKKIDISKAVAEFIKSGMVVTTANGIGRSGKVTIFTRQADVKSL
jgi:hypothetical protein